MEKTQEDKKLMEVKPGDWFEIPHGDPYYHEGGFVHVLSHHPRYVCSVRNVPGNRCLSQLDFFTGSVDAQLFLFEETDDNTIVCAPKERKMMAVEEIRRFGFIPLSEEPEEIVDWSRRDGLVDDEENELDILVY